MRRLLFAGLLALTPGLLHADPCSAVLVPNFHRVAPFGNVMSLAWDQPNPASPITFDVVQQTKADYCTTVLDPEQVVATTSATSYSFTLTPGKVAVVHVRKAGDPCFNSNFVVGDAFTSPPSKPNAPTVTSTGQMSVNYNDATTQLVITRSPRTVSSCSTRSPRRSSAARGFSLAICRTRRRRFR